ncbi:MarR family transcriptional regulator [Verrucosispora sioxanthis]|uniref:MarR family transcriptional regulator n=1 Tax=Verrucosispora sioxanthis TaxID=2499994 RepID=UPI001C11B30D|nr:MarR family transcriptional regulator [Verrucosispora sioxanthis]
MTDETLDQLGDALSDLHRVLRRRALQRTGRAALPDAQVEVLRLVQRQPGISVREAAARLGTAANTVSNPGRRADHRGPAAPGRGGVRAHRRLRALPPRAARRRPGRPRRDRPGARLADHAAELP